MSLEKVTQTFTGGYNGDASPFVLDTTKVSDVRNMLFERGLLVSRPGVVAVNSKVTGAGAYIKNVMSQPFSFNVGGAGGVASLPRSPIVASYHNALADTTARLFSIGVNTSGALIESADWALPANTLDTVGQYSQMVAATGAPIPILYVGGFFDSGTGLPRIIAYDTTGAGVASGITPGTVPNLLTDHLSRLIIANAQYAAVTPVVAWSKIGDATVWSGDFTTGSVSLTEAFDGLVGLCTIRGMLVIGRPTGFHWGVSTGNGSNPYDWKCVSRHHVGPVHGGCFIPYGNRIFFASESDIHIYDLDTVQDIGEGVTTEMFSLCKTYGLELRGFMVRGPRKGRRTQLHIVLTRAPIVGGPSIAPWLLPHYVYDVEEQKWSRHFYDAAAVDTSPLEGFAYPFTVAPSSGFQQAYQQPTLVRRSNPAQYLIWNSALDYPCESTQSFTTGRIQIGDPTEEFCLVRMLVVAYCSTADTTCTATFYSYLGNTTSAVAVNFTLGSGWQRVWVNTVKVGQFFTVKVDSPAGVHVKFRQLILVHEADGTELRV